MKANADLLHLVLDENHPFIQRLHTVSCLRVSHLVAVLVLVSKSPLIYLTMAPKCKTSGAGNLDMEEKP